MEGQTFRRKLKKAMKFSKNLKKQQKLVYLAKKSRFKKLE